jgi:alcohol dehydrogenase YqhD (iron-dependent ADH family)
MKNFNFDTATRILFGKGKTAEIIPEIIKSGSRVLFAYGEGSIKRTGLYNQVVNLLNNDRIYFAELSGIQPNPRMNSVREGVRLCRENKLDFILAVGGGSVLDCAKAIAAGVFYDGDAWDFMIKKATVKEALPIGTILTLAATGSEMNGNAVISNEETSEKRAMSSALLRPVFSVLDPELTFSVNKWHTAAGVTDIMSHIFEVYYTPDTGTLVQDALSESLLKICIECGPVAIEEPENYVARANILWAGTLALNGLLGAGKSVGDWATHAIEHELSAIYDLTHGAGLAIVFPAWMEYVLNRENSWRFAKLARNVWGIEDTDDMAAARKGINAARGFFSSLGMPVSLKEVNIDESHLTEMGKKACVFGPVGLMKELTADDVNAILRNAL